MNNRIGYNFNQVFNVLIKKHNKTQIAKKMGYTTTTQLNNVIDGTSCISTQAIMNLIKNFNVSPNYLFMGVGGKFLDELF
jgi:plasmid maintenance system antidote protein VapI